MFFLWGLLVASPIGVALILCSVVLLHFVVTPARVAWHLETWRPTGVLAAVTAVVSVLVAAGWMWAASTGVLRDNDENFWFVWVLLNVSASLLCVTLLLEVIECGSRRAIDKATVVVLHV